jgi:hypothetical protein
LDFVAFRQLFRRLQQEGGVLQDRLRVYSRDKKNVCVKQLIQFCIKEQNERPTQETAERMMIEALREERTVHYEISWTLHEFIDYLFSSQNQVFNSAHERIHQNMDRPLPHYWIASSHNTYLTGKSRSFLLQKINL